MGKDSPDCKEAAAQFEVDSEDGAEAREFAAKVNTAAKSAGVSSDGEILWMPSCTICKWMGDRAPVDHASEQAAIHDGAIHDGNKTAVLIGDTGKFSRPILRSTFSTMSVTELNLVRQETFPNGVRRISEILRNLCKG